MKNNEKEKSERNGEIKNNEKLILVATQIVEASVDVDFDILITEISTIDSQVQRWGRIWRNKNENYEKDEPNIYIFAGIDRGTTAIYSKDVVEKTKDVLKEYGGKILSYKEEKDIVEKVFSDKDIESKYTKKIHECLDSLKYFTVEKKTDAQRLFRKIANVPILFADFIEDEKIRKLITYENRYKSWKELLENAKENAKKENDKLDKKYEVLKELVKSTINIPFYLFEKIPSNKYFEFHGFYVISGLNKETKEKIKEYGIDKYTLEELNVDLDNVEINFNVIY